MADSLPPQTVEPPGTSAPRAQAVQGVTGGVPVAISGSFSATTSAKATAAAPAYTEGVDSPISQDLSGNLRTLATISGVASFSDGTVDRQARVQDADTGAGTHWTAESVLVKPASGGPVAFGTSTDPIRVDPTGSTTQPISVSSLPLPSGAAQEHTGAASFHSTRLTDGTTFYKGTTPGDTQPISVASLPLPSGASTEATLALIKAKTDNLDVLLSTRTKPADTQKVDGSAVTQPVSGTFWQATQPVSGPLTDTQLRASAVPVSGTVAVSNFPATTDVSDRAARLLGKGSVTDGALDLALINTAPAADTGQIAVPVRVVSQLGGTSSSIGGTDEVGNTAAFNFTRGDGRLRLEVQDVQTRRLLEQLLLASMGTSLFCPTGAQPTFNGQSLMVSQPGAVVARLIAAGTTNATSVKSTPGQVYGWFLYNSAAAARFVKLYNLQKAPAVGTDTPYLTIPLPAGSAANVWLSGSIPFTQGVSYATTVNAADSDATAVTAGDIILNLFYL